MARPAIILGVRLALAFVLAAAALPGNLAQNMAADRAALLALRDALDPGRRLPWDPAAATPCNGTWRGVGCDTAGSRVVELRLPAKSLRGTIPAGTVGNLTALQKLSLRFNAVSGAIPADLGNCAELRGIFLRGNRLDGAFPEGLFSLARLRKLDLAGNRLAGGVPLGFNRLTRLDTLLLDGNRLEGAIPEGLNMSKLSPAGFNVSFNAGLTGPVPASLAGMPATAFLGTGLCGGPLAACATSSSDAKRNKLSRWAIVGIVVGAVLLILLVVALLALLRRRRRAPATSRPAANVNSATTPITVKVDTAGRDAAVTHSGSAPAAAALTGGGSKQLVFLGGAPDRPYDLEALLRASAEVLSKGAHGTTYRATLDGGAPVLAVKRLRDARLPEREFRDVAAELGALRHQNLPSLRAYFFGWEEKLLVYDFVGAGSSIAALLHGPSSCLFCLHISIYICIYIYINELACCERRQRRAPGLHLARAHRAGGGARRGVHPPRRVHARQHQGLQHRGHRRARRRLRHRPRHPSARRWRRRRRLWAAARRRVPRAGGAELRRRAAEEERRRVQLRRGPAGAAERAGPRAAGGRRRGPAAVGAVRGAGGVDVRGVRLRHR